MRRLIALVLAVALMVGVAVPAAQAGTGTNVALGLASFAVFSQVVGLFHPRVVYAGPPRVIVERPVYAPVAVVASSTPSVVQYPHGRYELRGDGVYTAYQWVWIPNAPAVPPPPPPPPDR
jgi:hypothetical protein